MEAQPKRRGPGRKPKAKKNEASPADSSVGSSKHDHDMAHAEERKYASVQAPQYQSELQLGEDEDSEYDYSQYNLRLQH